MGRLLQALLAETQPAATSATSATHGRNVASVARVARPALQETGEESQESRKSQGLSTRNPGAWLEAVAGHLGTSVEAFMASGVILPTEVPDYLDRDPVAFAEAVRDLVALRCPLRSHATAVPSRLQGTVGLIALSDQPRNQAVTLPLDRISGRHHAHVLLPSPARQPRWLSDIDPLRSNKHHDVTQ